MQPCLFYKTLVLRPSLVEIFRVETGLKLVSVTGVKCDSGEHHWCHAHLFA